MKKILQRKFGMLLPKDMKLAHEGKLSDDGGILPDWLRPSKNMKKASG